MKSISRRKWKSQDRDLLMCIVNDSDIFNDLLDDSCLHLVCMWTVIADHFRLSNTTTWFFPAFLASNIAESLALIRWSND